MLSRYLPESFDASKPVGLLAGQGLYPRLLAERMLAHGLDVYLMAVEGETDEDLTSQFAENRIYRFPLGQLKKFLKKIQEVELGYLIAAGQFTPNKLFKGLNPDMKLMSLFLTLREKNAHTIFTAVLKEVEKVGVMPLDARCFMDVDIPSQVGALTRKAKILKERDLEFGASMVKEIARLDIGQSIVVSHGTVLEVEGFQGTNQLIERAGASPAKHKTLFKASKPNHNFHFDVPVFGKMTLDTMAEAGLACAAIERNNTIILDQASVLEYAAQKQIELYAF